MKDNKLNIAVVMGGVSNEHEISLETGITIINNLDKQKYNIQPVVIDKSGMWHISAEDTAMLPDQIGRDFINRFIADSDHVEVNHAVGQLKSSHVDIVYIALHGKFGEDGTVQGLLEMSGIRYTGSGVLASSLAMDKIKSMELFSYHHFNVPPFTFFRVPDFERDKEDILQRIENDIHFPLVLKPNDSGSSELTFIINDVNELMNKVSNELNKQGYFIIQHYIKGDEVTCAILDCEEKPVALPPTQIIPKKSDFFDYKAKYEPGASDEITPPRMTDEIIKNIQKVALKAHKVLGCAGFSRTDMIVQDHTIFILETNTIPGMTSNSLYPQAAKEIGLSFPALLDMLLKKAIAKDL